jgi:hypothetical protein
MKEHESLSNAARKIRGYSLETGIPILMAAHVRKRSKRTDPLTPDDIHGSGSILKESTTCIALTRKPGDTHVAIWKSRIGGELLKFDQLYDEGLRMWSGAARNIMATDMEETEAVAAEFEGRVGNSTKEKSQRGFNLITPKQAPQEQAWLD